MRKFPLLILVYSCKVEGLCYSIPNLLPSIQLGVDREEPFLLNVYQIHPKMHILPSNNVETGRRCSHTCCRWESTPASFSAVSGDHHHHQETWFWLVKCKCKADLSLLHGSAHAEEVCLSRVDSKKLWLHIYTLQTKGNLWINLINHITIFKLSTCQIWHHKFVHFFSTWYSALKSSRFFKSVDGASYLPW